MPRWDRVLHLHLLVVSTRGLLLVVPVLGSGSWRWGAGGLVLHVLALGSGSRRWGAGADRAVGAVVVVAALLLVGVLNMTIAKKRKKKKVKTNV